MTEQISAEAPASANEEPRPEETLPEGEYAIVEQLGHRTMIGRVCEVERFGTKLMQIEALFAGQLLPPILIGGSAIYAYTPVSAAVAAQKQPKRKYQLPPTLAAIAPDLALPAPAEPVFAPTFLADDHEDEFGDESG